MQMVKSEYAQEHSSSQYHSLWGKNMHISKSNYHHFARFLGFLLVLYGGGSIVAFASYAATGTNSLSSITNGMGVVFLGLMGAFPLPLGISLFWANDHTQALLRVISVALGFNALIRLSLVMIPELQSTVGTITPVVEFCVFGFIAVLAFAIRPNVTEQTPVLASNH